MVYEKFVKQLDGCTYCSGGLNCNCASDAMWIYRASQGRMTLMACTVRRETGDRIGGTNLPQVEAVNIARGLTGGRIYRPGSFDLFRDLILTGRYGGILQVGYSVIANTEYDCFSGSFRGGHSIYVSRGTEAYARGGDPGADGRRPTIPEGWQDYPWALLERAAGALPLTVGGSTLASVHGPGKAYFYVTPADPIVVAQKWRVTITGYTVLYSAPNGTRVGAVSQATYICLRSKVNGEWWFKVLTKADGSATANKGRYFQPNRNVTARYA